MNRPFAKPFHNIALSLSGGGFRAAAFHLGAITYLQHLKGPDGAPLLRQLKVLSTISGGSLTGIKYACYCAGTPQTQADFRQFFAEMYHFLARVDVPGEAFALLNGKCNWGKKRPHNLIMAFAEVYHHFLFDKANFGLLLPDNAEPMPEVIFNATDLEHMLLFRFQSSGVFGNGKFSISDGSFHNIRLADIAAASSCFPAGFEPMLMPDDFEAPGSPLQVKSQDIPKIRLMDGGIVDNQGLTSVLLAEDRLAGKAGKPVVGTLIHSDVSTDTPPEPLSPPARVPWLKRLSLRTFNIAVALFFLAAVALGMVIKATWVKLLCTGFATLLGGGLLVYFLFRNLLPGVLRKLVGQDSPAFFHDLPVIERMPLSHLFHLASVRLESFYYITSSVLLERCRDLNHTLLYSNSDWRYRVVSNFIHTLQNEHKTGLGSLKPHVELANQMGTTLWFSDADKASGMLQSLIITGQANLCAQLRSYIEKIKKPEPGVLQSFKDDQALLDFVDSLDQQLEADQLKFREQATWLLAELEL